MGQQPNVRMYVFGPTFTLSMCKIAIGNIVEDYSNKIVLVLFTVCIHMLCKPRSNCCVEACTEYLPLCANKLVRECRCKYVWRGGSVYV